MQALVLRELNSPLALEPQVLNDLAPDHARVRIHAAALNHRDVWITQGQYPGIVTPVILGSDGSGVVSEIRGDAHWLGEEVLVNPGLHWGDNPAFQSKDFQILGLPQNGTLAHYVDVPIENLFKKPSHLSHPQAAGLPLAGVTAWRALMTRARCQPGDRVLVSGIGGGVALFALQFATSIGCEVVVTSSSQGKLERASKLGAHGGVLYTEDKWGKSLRAQYPKGFDVIIDGAGGEGFGQLARLLAPAGRLAFYGGTCGKWPPIAPQHLFFKQTDILASTMGSPQDFRAMVKHVLEHAIEPIIDCVYPLENGNEAIAQLESGSQFGKIVLQAVKDN